VTIFFCRKINFTQFKFFYIFVSINWLANSIDGYKCPCNLVEFVEKDLNFEKEL
jgi:hypothetical protein